MASCVPVLRGAATPPTTRTPRAVCVEAGAGERGKKKNVECDEKKKHNQKKTPPPLLPPIRRARARATPAMAPTWVVGAVVNLVRGQRGGGQTAAGNDASSCVRAGEGPRPPRPAPVQTRRPWHGGGKPRLSRRGGAPAEGEGRGALGERAGGRTPPPPRSTTQVLSPAPSPPSTQIGSVLINLGTVRERERGEGRGGVLCWFSALDQRRRSPDVSPPPHPLLLPLLQNLMKLGHNRRQAVEDSGKLARPVR